MCLHYTQSVPFLYKMWALVEKGKNIRILAFVFTCVVAWLLHAAVSLVNISLDAMRPNFHLVFTKFPWNFLHGYKMQI